MKTALVVAALLAPAVWAQSADPATLAAELRRIENAPDATVPDSWQVDTPDGRYSISTEPLRHMEQRDAREWLEQLARQLDSFAAQKVPASARPRLEKILARREFAGIGPPGAWERLRQRIATWVENLLRRVFGFVARHPTGSTILFWLAVSGAVAFLALTLFRVWMREEPVRAIRMGTPGPHAQSWQEWLIAARSAAGRGDTRRAIHAAYWAAILRLQETGSLPREAVRTPREYLREVPAPLREPLAALTNLLERFWYARREATVEDFSESLKALEALGCRVAE